MIQRLHYQSGEFGIQRIGARSAAIFVQDVIATAGQRYTLTQLRAEAAAVGHRVSERMVLGWVAQGLIDRPDRRGLGRGKGSVATWPDEQRRLFLALLAKRGEIQSDRKPIRALLNLPVWLWLYWGDQYVPLRQVRLALRGWGPSALGGSWTASRAVAAAMIRTVRHPKARAKDRRALLEHVTQMLYASRFDPDQLVPLVARVVDPLGTGQPRGPAGAQLTPEGLVEIFRARYLAITRLAHTEGPDAISDGLFHWARLFYLTGIRDYLSDQHLLARDADLGRFFARPDASALANEACLELATIVGFALAGGSAAPVGSLEHPQTWKDNRLRSRIVRTVPDECGIGVARVAVEVQTESGLLVSPTPPTDGAWRKGAC
jgi:hypothetical protein